MSISVLLNVFLSCVAGCLAIALWMRFRASGPVSAPAHGDATGVAAQVELEVARTTIRGLESQKETLETLRRELAEEVRALREQREAAERNASALSSSVQAGHHQRQQLELALADTQARIAQLLDENRANLAALGAAREQCAASQQQVIEWQKREGELLATRNQLDAYQQQVSQLREATVGQQLRIDALTAREAELVVHQQRLVDLQAQLMTARERAAKAETELEHERNVFGQVASRRDQEAEQTSNELRAAIAAEKATRSELGKLRELLAAQEQQLASLSERELQLVTLRESTEVLRSQLNASNERNAGLEAEINQERKISAERQQSLREAAESGQTARTELARIREHAGGQEQQITELRKREVELRELRQQAEAMVSAFNEKGERLATLEAELMQERRASEQKLEMHRELHAQLEAKFNGLAAQVLERNTEKFESSTKLRLNEMAEAIAKHVKDLQQRVEVTHSQDVQDRIALRTELQKMVEASRRIDEDAANLTKALKTDRKAQGAWGELILDRILEQCGLREGTEYEKQVVLVNEDDQRMRPDVVVRLPGKRSVVIDAKMSLVAYSEYVAAEDEASATEALNRHLASVRNHIRGLAEKEYWRLNGLETGDYVLMFLPIESAFAEALRGAPGMFEEAFRCQIILTSPTTLLATLRTIEHTWRVERQNATARTIVDQAGRLYDKMAGFVDDLRKVGASLDAAKRAYDGAYNKFSSGKGNLVGQADKLRELGVKLKKALPAEMVDQARAGELLDTVENDNLQTPDSPATASHETKNELPEGTVDAA